jgi:hypothetical protein
MVVVDEEVTQSNDASGSATDAKSSTVCGSDD